MTRNSQMTDAQQAQTGFILDAPAGAIVFALGTLLIGFAAAWIAFAVAPPVPPYRQLPLLYPPLWFFWAVWLIIYPCWGLATWLVWRKRCVSDVRGALALYVITLVGNTLFLPISNLSGGNPAVLSLMDANGVLSSWITYWLYTRYSKWAGRFLLPLLLWMPLTLLLKLWLWQLNR